MSPYSFLPQIPKPQQLQQLRQLQNPFRQDKRTAVTLTMTMTLTLCLLAFHVLFTSQTLGSSESDQFTLYLKGGANIQGRIIEITPESVTLSTQRGELLILTKNLEESSKLELENKLITTKETIQLVEPKEKSKLISIIHEERELKNQKLEGDSPRITFGRKDFVFRKYTQRGSNIDYIFTPVGHAQVYDSEETLRVTYHPSIKNLIEAKNAVQEIIGDLGGAVQIKPNTPGGYSQTKNVGIDFVGSIQGKEGNPSRVVFGRMFQHNNKFHTVLYTKFGKEKSFDETRAWLGRNIERLQVIIQNLNNIPDESTLSTRTSEIADSDIVDSPPQN